jgi:hypothetical protein
MGGGKLNNASTRHHYIPRFYLNGFTENRKFSIYMVDSRRFKKAGGTFSPSSHFYIENDNTFSANGKTTDILEESFSRKDSLIAKTFDKIRSATSNDYCLTHEDIGLLQYFVSILFWRIPSTKILVDHFAKKYPLSNFGISIRDVVTGNRVIHAEQKLYSEPDYPKLLREYLPDLTLKDMMKFNKGIHIIRFKAKSLPKLCSDNPLIFRNPWKLDIYNDDFILPVTNDLIVLRINKLRAQYWNTLKIDIDMLVFLQADKLVSCTDLTYPSLLEVEYNRRFNSTSELREHIFRSFDAEAEL